MAEMILAVLIEPVPNGKRNAPIKYKKIFNIDMKARIAFAA